MVALYLDGFEWCPNHFPQSILSDVIFPKNVELEHLKETNYSETNTYFLLKVVLRRESIRFDAQTIYRCKIFHYDTEIDKQVSLCDGILRDALGLFVQDSFHHWDNEKLDGFCEQDEAH